MKKYLVTPIMCLLLLGAVPVINTGCKSTPEHPQAVAFLAFSDTWAVVKGATRAYADATVAGKVSVEDQQKIDAAYEKFRLSFLAALELASHDWHANTPDEVDQLAFEVLNLIKQLDL